MGKGWSDIFTLIYPYYNAPGMLRIQLSGWDLMPDWMKERVLVILVDDCSQVPALETVRSSGPVDFQLQIYRVLKDIPWNQHGARNLGAKVAPNGWLFMSDIDHTLPTASLAYLLDMEKDTDRFYTLQRLTAVKDNDHSFRYEVMLGADGKSKPHPNTFLVTRTKFWKTGGYDEDYCGMYGGDGPFMRWMDRVALRTHLPEISLIRWSREVVPDASQPEEFREKYREVYRQAFRRKGELKERKPGGGVIRFPWERVL